MLKYYYTNDTNNISLGLTYLDYYLEIKSSKSLISINNPKLENLLLSIFILLI